MADFADSPKADPADVIRQVLDGIESGADEVLADGLTRRVRAQLGEPISGSAAGREQYGGLERLMPNSGLAPDLRHQAPEHGCRGPWERRAEPEHVNVQPEKASVSSFVLRVRGRWARWAPRQRAVSRA